MGLLVTGLDRRRKRQEEIKHKQSVEMGKAVRLALSYVLRYIPKQVTPPVTSQTHKRVDVKVRIIIAKTVKTYKFGFDKITGDQPEALAMKMIMPTKVMNASVARKKRINR